MLIKEYRIVVPCSLEEYQRGVLYAVAKQSRLESSGGEGVEFLDNHPYTDEKTGKSGIYTKKLVRLGEKLPKWTSLVLPSAALVLEEQCWNEYPHLRTVYHCAYFDQRFTMSVETMHLEDSGGTENALQLEEKELSQRQVEYIQVTEPTEEPDGLDLGTWKSEKAARGPLTSDWAAHCTPVMCCYKLVRVNFNFFGFQSKVEKVIQQRGMQDVFHRMHRLLIATMDEWFEMTPSDIKAFEEETAKGLEQIKQQAPPRSSPHTPRSPRSPRSRLSVSSRGSGASPEAADHLLITSLPEDLPGSQQEPRPEFSACRHCRDEVAVMHCADCDANFCDDCHRVLHFNRKRRGHKCKPLPVTPDMLFGYAHLGKPEGVTMALNNGVYIDAQDALGRTALHLAVGSGSVECVQLLLGLNADTDIQDSKSRSPLHVAITHSKLEAAYALLQRGCNLVLQDSAGLTAYDLCVVFGENEAKGAISAAGMLRKHTAEMADRERVARRQRDATERSLQRLQQELQHVKACNPRAELEEMVKEMQALWHTLLNVSKINKSNSGASAEEAVRETQKNIQLYTSAVDHLTGMYAANSATDEVWSPIQKILEDGGRMKKRLLGFAAAWSETTGRSVEEFDLYEDD